MSIPTPTFGALRGPLVDKSGNPSRAFLKKLQEWEAKLNQAITLFGAISAQAKIQGRTEGIGTTVVNLTSTGKVNSLDNVNDGVAFVRTNPNEKAGGGRGFVALDANSRLSSTTHLTANNASNTPTTSNLCTQSGTSTLILVASFVMQYPFGTVNYNSGSVDPGAFGTYYIYADDPTYAGGAVAYLASTANPNITSAEGRIFLGKLTTSGGGGGGSGGSGGGGPCFSGKTFIVTKRGSVPINEIKVGDLVRSLSGWRKVVSILAHDYDGQMQEMSRGELVTPEHRIWIRPWSRWIPAVDVFPAFINFKGKVYNLELRKPKSKSDRGKCYALANGWTAHNALK